MPGSESSIMEEGGGGWVPSRRFGLRVLFYCVEIYRLALID